MDLNKWSGDLQLEIKEGWDMNSPTPNKFLDLFLLNIIASLTCAFELTSSNSYFNSLL